MRVQVLFFGVLREMMGAPEQTVEVETGSTAGEVVAVCQHHGAAASLWGSIAIAVNREYAQRSQVLAEGDEVALLPPVSGGCSRLLSSGSDGCFSVCSKWSAHVRAIYCEKI